MNFKKNKKTGHMVNGGRFGGKNKMENNKTVL